MKYYKLNDIQLEKELNTNLFSGLSDEQCTQRESECSNIDCERSFSIDKINFNFLNAAITLLLSSLMLVLAAVFDKDINNLSYFAAILVVVLISYCLFFLFVYLTNKKISSEKKSVFGKLNVLRNGTTVFINIQNILYGDVVFLNEGDYIPFDARVIDSEAFLVDETNVTGRSIVKKYNGIIDNDNVSASELYNTVFSGSFVISGSAKVVVTDVGQRVLFVKSRRHGEKTKSNTNLMFGFSKVLLLFLAVLATAVTIVCSAFTKDIYACFSLCLLFISIFVSDYFTKYGLLVFTASRLSLSSKNIFLKNSAVFDKLMQSSVLVWNYSKIVDAPADIRTFYYSKQLMDVSEVGKHNIEPFIYAALGCGNRAFSSFKDSILKILKKANIDFYELESFCPEISNYFDFEKSIVISGRSYQGNNILLAAGNLSRILELCSMNLTDIESDALDELHKCSTDLFAVAIKQIDVIPSDLSFENNGYELISILAVDRPFTTDLVANINKFNSQGYANIIAYSGSRESAGHIVNDTNICIMSLLDFEGLSKKRIDGNIIIYDCDNMDSILKKLDSLSVRYVKYNKFKNITSKNVTISCSDSKPYLKEKSDVVSDSANTSAFILFNKVYNSYSVINKLFENIFIMMFVYLICAPLFTFIKTANIFSPVLATFLYIFVLMYYSLLNIYYSDTEPDNKLKNILKFPLRRINIINSLIVVVFVALFIAIFAMFFDAGSLSGMIAVVVCMCFTTIKKDKLLFSFLSFIPVILSVVLFLTPVSGLFLVGDFSLVSAFLAIGTGVIIKLFTYIINKFLRK